MKTLKTLFPGALYYGSEESKRKISEEMLYGITLTMLVSSIFLTGFIFSFAF